MTGIDHRAPHRSPARPRASAARAPHAARLAAALCALALASLASPAAAQPAADRTGTGGGPGSTITAPNTNSLGVTKPPGTSLGPGEVPPPRAERRERARTDRIERSICDGC